MMNQYGTPANACSRIVSSAASDNATVAQAAHCCLKGLQGYNAGASTIFIKLYNKGTVPTAADTPFKTLAVPATTPFAYDFGAGFECTQGLSLRVTGGAADADNTAIGAGALLGLNVDSVQ